MKPVVLIVLDGWGIAPPGPGNPLTLASLPNYNSYLKKYPHTTLDASGEAVGLPASEVGNTEVGHINLGAGRIVLQDLPRINLAIADGSFYKNEVFARLLSHLKKTKGRLHIVGLVGEGTVHSSTDHLFALLYFAHENKLSDTYIHAITDGRDSPPQSATEVIARLEERLKSIGTGRIATVMGRYYAMDRDHRWERTQKAYECLIGKSRAYASSPQTAIDNEYRSKRTDEFITPTAIQDNGHTIGRVQKGDAVIFLNYRIDRPRQLTKAFVLDDFEHDANKAQSFDPYAVKYFKTHKPQENLVHEPFERGPKVEDLFFATMTEYEHELGADVIFPPIVVEHPLGRVLAQNKLRQLRMSESEKERFVTFYFNGLNKETYPMEDRIIVPSPKVATYDQKPEMSAHELTNLLIEQSKKDYSFILVNFANADMVGHTGNIDASIRAVQTLDECLGKISAQLGKSHTILITADHGNVEEKISRKTGGISTEHTGNEVPFIAIDASLEGKSKLQPGILGDVAPTILSLLEINKPEGMTGRNLLASLT